MDRITTMPPEIELELKKFELKISKLNKEEMFKELMPSDLPSLLPSIFVPLIGIAMPAVFIVLIGRFITATE